jgi:hypothetical protein
MAPARATSTSASRGRGRRACWLTGVVLLPLLVAAVVLLVRRPDYRPISDYALTELQVRDIGRHEVLTGLYSRSDWRHPGPMFFYLLAPLYRLSGEASLSMFFTALAVNAAAVAGIAFLAWRRGGASMLLCALLGCALLMRTLGAEFLLDPWNNYVVTLPFGLLLFATWGAIRGDRWALPITVVSASFLAQTHVGFVLLAVPLAAVAAVGFVGPSLRRGVDPARRRAVLVTLAWSAAAGVVLWLPVLVDVLVNDPSNLQRIAHYFRTTDEPAQTLRTGWRIVTGQFAWPPEWLTEKRTDVVGYGESPFKHESVLPWMLVPVVLATAYQWWRRRDDHAGARSLGAVLGLAIGLGVVGVARTLGPALDYRLRWTWMLGLTGFVLVVFTLWQVAVRRWPHSDRALTVTAATLVVLVSVANVVSAARADAPWHGDSEVMADLAPRVLDELDPAGGQVLLADRLSDAAWYTRGLVLQLERAGVDARVPSGKVPLFGESRALRRDEPVQARLVVVAGRDVSNALRDPDLRLVARWRPDPDSSHAAGVRRRARLDRRLREGTLTPFEHFRLVRDTTPGPPDDPITGDLAVFAEIGPSSRD